MSVVVQRFVGTELGPYLPALARLRIDVFREWPYLYDGSLEYEERYLRSYQTEGAMIAVAFDGDRVVGASTALPLSAHGEVPPSVFEPARLDPETIYYFGESVLAREYRGRGIGHRFFDERERYAVELGYPWAAFCAVERPNDHPRRPHDYVPHDAFWTKRGYLRRPDLVTAFRWQDVGDEVETEKTMIFWLKQLGHAPLPASR
jgi:GNAT superfamily N-acetyltransferase